MMASMRCPVCTTCGASPLALSPYVQCHLCGVVYRNEPPAPLAIDAPLPADYYTSAMGAKFPINRERVAWVTRKARVTRGVAADIGSRDGTILRVLRDAGWQATGYEADPRFTPFAKEHLGVTIRPTLFATETTEPNSLDLVTALHVIEHVSEPLVLLAAIRRALRPTGYLFVETPNLRYIQRRQIVPTHVVLYTRHTLAQTLRAAGFVVRATSECAPGGPRTYDQLAILAQPGPDVDGPPPWHLDAVDRLVPAEFALIAAGGFRAWSSEWPPDRRSWRGISRGLLRRGRVYARWGRYRGWW
jgi:2-polyprenyl-3-methyl-5-hydroxy-6-metoxy-1,4-benzoquinol methylase